ncbi:MAG: hypothetical protein ACJAT6_000328, partial [Akkermansiaceae bacterium]
WTGQHGEARFAGSDEAAVWMGDQSRGGETL